MNKEKKQLDKIHIVLITISVILLITNVIIYFKSHEFDYKSKAITNNTLSNVLEECNNLSIKMTARCLNRDIRGIYNYSIERKSIYYNGKLENYYNWIRDNGGVCHHYAKLYVNLAEELGYEGETITFGTHQVAIIYNNNSDYCLMDQVNYYCVELEEDPRLEIELK